MRDGACGAGALPAMPGALPAMPGALPAMPGALPAMPGALPAMPGALPAMPAMPGALPAMPCVEGWRLGANGNARLGAAKATGRAAPSGSERGINAMMQRPMMQWRPMMQCGCSKR
jgi:hypothetical protein